MGIIYNENVEEKKLYKAYGLTVYGKINRYVWTIHNGKEDECIIALRITDSAGNNVSDLYLGNNCIMYDTFDRTIDNFLYWISTENPDAEQIEKQVYQSLCQSDCWFNDRIRTRKFNAEREEENRKRIEEQKKKEQAALDKIKEYCRKKDLIFYYDGWKVYLLKALNTKGRELVNQAIEEKNHDYMISYIQFSEKYPDNKDLRIIQSGAIQEINIEH